MLKQLKRTRVRKIYFINFLDKFTNILLGFFAILTKIQRTQPINSSINKRKNITLKLSRKSGQNLIYLTLLGSGRGEEPIRGKEQPFNSFKPMSGDRSTFTESILPTLKYASCNTPKSYRPTILPGIIDKINVA